MAPDVFSFFQPEQSLSTETRTSRAGQAGDADATGQLERTLSVFDPNVSLFESATIEVERLEARVIGLEARIRKATEPDQPLALGETVFDRLEQCASGAMTQLEEALAGFSRQAESVAAGLAQADRLAAAVSGVETRIAALEERQHALAIAADRIVPGLAEADRLAAIVSSAATRIATLEEREHSLSETADRIAPCLTEGERLAAVVSGIETRIAALEERQHSLASAADRIAPGLAEADRLAAIVSSAATRIATLEEREHAFSHAADRIAPCLAEADRLAEVVSGLEARIAALLAQEQSITRTVEPILGQPSDDRAVEPAEPLPVTSVDVERSHDRRSRLVEPRRAIRGLAFATGVVGILVLLGVGSGVVARWGRAPVQAAVKPHTSEAVVAPRASSPVVPTPVANVEIAPTPAPLATAAPLTSSVIPASTESASRASRSSKVTSHHHTRQRQAADVPSARAVFAGNLVIQSNPAGGTVFMDRQNVGETPLQLTGVAAGSHVIRIEHEGHERWTAAVQVNAGKLVKVSATLDPQR